MTIYNHHIFDKETKLLMMSKTKRHLFTGSQGHVPSRDDNKLMYCIHLTYLIKIINSEFENI